MSLVLKRRSIRKFKNIRLSDYDLKMLLKAGMNAPSACNMQPWEFVLIDDREILDELSEIANGARILKNCRHAICVVGDLKKSASDLYWTVDCSASVMNILLRATEMNIGACWIGVYPKEDRIPKVKNILGIEGDYIPHSIIALGVADETKDPNDRFNEELIHYNTWK